MKPSGTNDKPKPEAMYKFRPQENGDFNMWTHGPHILTPNHSTGDSDNGPGNDSEDDLDTRGSDIDVSDIASTCL